MPPPAGAKQYHAPPTAVARMLGSASHAPFFVLFCPLSHTKAPAGAIHITAECENGKAKNITFRNTPSFVGKLGVEVDVPGGVGKVSVDIAYGKMPSPSHTPGCCLPSRCRAPHALWQDGDPRVSRAGTLPVAVTRD